jgi:hypothetical protein
MGNQENTTRNRGRDLVSKKSLNDVRENTSADPTEDPELKTEEGENQGEDEGEEGIGNGEGDDDDDSGSVYEVERVVAHKRERGVLSFHLKWKGYPDTSSTWEKEKFVFCKDLVDNYWDRYESAGGSRTDTKGKEPKPQVVKSNGQVNVQPSSKRSAKSPLPASKKKGRGEDGEDEVSGGTSTKKQKTRSHSPQRKRVQDRAAGQRRKEDKEDDDHMDEQVEAQKDEGGENDSTHPDEEDVVEERENWMPPKAWTSWDEHLEVVQTVERSLLGMTVHVTWKNGKESELPLEDAHQKCPQKLIAFYEQHLKFTPA